MSYDQAFVAGVVVQGKADAWIGLRRKVRLGRATKKDSLQLGSLVQFSRNSLISSVNRLFNQKPPPTPATSDGKCLPFWILYGRYCYYVYNGQKGFSWPDSRHYCQTVKADLASLHSRAEVEFIRNLNYTKYHNVWIGLTRDLGWGWTDGTALGFLNWSPGEPNTAFHPGEVGEESCVEMYPDGRWNDNNCLQKRGFACRQCKDLILEYRTSGSFQAAFILFF
uniref:C-type lectin domain-containing protein n=1 Tax=Cyclopterus lumpus TaxID=8103 RepID=A0A8C2WHF1_CYCLU